MSASTSCWRSYRIFRSTVQLQRPQPSWPSLLPEFGQSWSRLPILTSRDSSECGLLKLITATALTSVFALMQRCSATRVRSQPKRPRPCCSSWKPSRTPQPPPLPRPRRQLRRSSAAPWGRTFPSLTRPPRRMARPLPFPSRFMLRCISAKC